VKLKFSLSSYWRVGSGHGGGVLADSVILRDATGLPTIPGRAIKGLLRDAMELASLSGAVTSERIKKWFGTPLAGHGDREQKPKDGDKQEVRLEEGRFKSEEGCLWIGSARLSDDWLEWAQATSEHEKQGVVGSLSCYQSSTAIDQRGVAKQHSLRVAEVAVPMTLWAEIRGPEDDRTWVDDLKHSLPLLRALGSRRNRGLGRVDVELEEGR